MAELDNQFEVFAEKVEDIQAPNLSPDNEKISLNTKPDLYADTETEKPCDNAEHDSEHDIHGLTEPPDLACDRNSSDNESESDPGEGDEVDLGDSRKEPKVKITASCPHAHQFVSDLSSEESSSSEVKQHISELRKQRRLKKRKKRQERLKRCCAGCDVQGTTPPVSPGLPSPIAVSSGMLQCNVIKSFDDVVDTLYNSEEEIDAAIQSYSTIGNRLANQHEHTFSDVETQARKSASGCGSPSSDPDLLVCDFSRSVGRKLANRNLDDNSGNSKNVSDSDGCCSGYLHGLSTAELSKMLQDLNLKLQNVSEVLIQHIKERDDLAAEKSVIAKHISQLTRLVQGQRTNDCSAFRKDLGNSRDGYLIHWNFIGK